MARAILEKVNLSLNSDFYIQYESFFCDTDLIPTYVCLNATLDIDFIGNNREQ